MHWFHKCHLLNKLKELFAISAHRISVMISSARSVIGHMTFFGIFMSIISWEETRGRGKKLRMVFSDDMATESEACDSVKRLVELVASETVRLRSVRTKAWTYRMEGKGGANVISRISCIIRLRLPSSKRKESNGCSRSLYWPLGGDGRGELWSVLSVASYYRRDFEEWRALSWLVKGNWPWKEERRVGGEKCKEDTRPVLLWLKSHKEGVVSERMLF